MRDSTARLCLSCGAQNPEPFLGIGYCGSCRVRLTRGGGTNAAKSLSEKSVWQTHRGAIVWTLMVGTFIAFATLNNRPTAPYSSANYTPPYVASPPRATAPNSTATELTPRQRELLAEAQERRRLREQQLAQNPPISYDDALAEAYRRGLLPPDKKAAYEEAIKRGLVGAPVPAQPTQLPPVFDEPVVAIATGEISYRGPRTRVAPLEIKAPYGSNYYIKMVHALTGRTHLVGFVRGGSTVEFLMPVGEYEMKYAVGTEWYGERYLFGPTTAYARADAPFNFTQGPDGYDGYTVELLEREGGNLETQDIPASAF